MPKEEDCIFCKIAKGEIPSDKIYEDKDTFAFLDINPLNKGHSLVIPKKHFETILDIDNETLYQLMMVIKKIIPILKKTGFGKGTTIIQNNGKEAGQEMPHLHFHIVPRTMGDKSIVGNSIKKPSLEEMKAIAEKIKKEIKK